MARFQEVHCYPYSGSYDEPWHDVGSSSEILDVDAAARTSRRVTESLSRELRADDLIAPRSSNRLFLGTSHTPIARYTPDMVNDGFLGDIDVPPGIRYLTPSERAELLLAAVVGILSRYGHRSGWSSTVLEDAAERCLVGGFNCTWTGRWRTSADRKRKVRMVGDIDDDGFARWRLEVWDRAGQELLVRSDEVIGGTWLQNFVRADQKARFIDRQTLAIPGAKLLLHPVRIDIDSGQMQNAPPGVETLTHPGVPELAEPMPPFQFETWTAGRSRPD